MPNPRTTQKARKEMREGYAPTTAAGEFVREEMHHKRAGKHGAESRRQAIAIGLSEARRAGVPIGRRPKRKSGTSRSDGKATRKRSAKRPSAHRGKRSR